MKVLFGKALVSIAQKDVEKKQNEEVATLR